MDGTVQSRRHGGSAVIDVVGTLPAAAGVANAELLRVLSLDPESVTCDLSGVTGDLDERALGSCWTPAASSSTGRAPPWSW